MKKSKFRSGYVRIRVQGKETERFLNLCGSRGIELKKIVHTGAKTLEFNLALRDFFFLLPSEEKPEAGYIFWKGTGFLSFWPDGGKGRLFSQGLFSVGRSSFFFPDASGISVFREM